MTADERDALICVCMSREAAGLLIPIVIQRKTPPTGRRVRVAPGLTGEIACVNEGAAGYSVVCYVDPAKLRAVLGA